MGWAIIIVLIAGMIATIIYGLSKSSKIEAIMKGKGFDMKDKIDTGKYIAGHPDIDKSLKLTFIIQKENEFHIFEYPNGSSLDHPIEKACIKNDLVKNIIIEDATTIEKRVTAARMLMVGLFAFAIKKKKKNEMSYITIQWNDGRFDHETYFEYEGRDAMQKANKARNMMIRTLKK